MRRSLLTTKPSPLIECRARVMRESLTPTEDLLWSRIRGCRLGVYFRRQVPIGRYIVDFLAPAVRLVVEVDGGYHAQRRTADARRDRKLARQGYRVLRVDAEVVRRRPEDAVALVRAALETPH